VQLRQRPPRPHSSADLAPACPLAPTRRPLEGTSRKTGSATHAAGGSREEERPMGRLRRQQRQARPTHCTHNGRDPR
jgi:hypothetical protein